MKKSLSIRNIALIAILGALGAVLMFLDFPIFVAPSFYKIDLGDLPCLIGAFAMGPIPAFFIQVVKIIIKLLLKPTSTAFVGEIAAFLFSTSYCVSAAIVYKNDKSKNGAIKSLIIASIIMIVIASLSNYCFVIPAYVNLYHMPLETIITMGTKIFPIVKDKLSFVLCCVVPFNLIKVLIVDVITFFLYKRVSRLIKNA